jgi:arylsulfatase A
MTGRLRILILGAVLLVTCSVLRAAEAANPTTKPNIVLILIDDFGYECVTANGGESYKTPVMDQLAATGVRFEQCHAQPLCTPTRAQLMTGISNRNNYSRFGNLDPSQTTFGNLLKNAGYTTCVTGKWQLENGSDGPSHFGFDEYCLWQLNQKGSRYKTPTLEANGKQVESKESDYGPDLVSDFALNFISHNKDKPFFLYYPMMLTHQPYDATPDSPDYLTSKAGKEKGKAGEGSHFADMTAYADKLIGKLVAKLEELNLRDNTIILILGDNGTGKATVSRFMGRDVKGGKGSPTMWGTRVPGIANWPGHFASGKVSSDLIDTTDFLPTICEATGTKVPPELKIDGRSFFPQLLGEKGNPRDWLYVWFNDAGGAKAEFEFAHDANYKLYTDGRFFGLQKDEKEKSPLAEGALDASAKAAKAKLQTALKQYEGPRPEFFVKLGEARKGGKEDGEGSSEDVPSKPKNKGKKGAGKKQEIPTEE